MAMASGALASPSLLGSKDGVVAGAIGRSWPHLKLSPSLELKCGSQKQIGRSSNLRSLRSRNCVVPAFRPAKLATSRWTTRVQCAMQQADVIVEESELKQALEKLKELVDIEGGNSKVAEDKELLRFLRSNSLDTQASAKAFASHQKWRKEFIPKGYIAEAEVQSELEAKKAYWIEKDKKGRPVLLTIGRNHVYNKKDFDEFKRFIVYFLECLIRESPPDAEQFICILDLKGLGLKNLDSKSFIASAQILQSHYPQRVDKIFMINVPAIFNGIWKVVKPFLNEDIGSRVVFVDKNKIGETLTNEIDVEYLPTEYGGRADLVPLQDALRPM
ncbi:unnamed protein product [Calypogeia fissa]